MNSINNLKSQGECRLDIRCGYDSDGATMHPHDLAGQAQADPRSTLLRCEKRDEYFFLYIL